MILFTGRDHRRSLITLLDDQSTGILHFIVLCLIALCRFCVFYKLKFCANPALSKSIGPIFPTAFAQFMSLCHILVILAIFQTCLLLYLLWCDLHDLLKTHMMLHIVNNEVFLN